MSLLIDERGSRCPAPVIALGRAAKGAEPGTTIILLSDDPASATDVPAWCRMRGAEFLGRCPANDGKGGSAYELRLGTQDGRQG